jgi:hypothetical protein
MDERYIYSSKEAASQLKKEKAGFDKKSTQILYYENKKIRHMDRMLDLFRTLFR